MNQRHRGVEVTRSLLGSGREELRTETWKQEEREGKERFRGRKERERESAASAQTESEPRQAKLSAGGAALRSCSNSVPAFAGGRRRGALWK